MMPWYLLIFFGLVLIYFWKSRTTKPTKFPPGPPRYPFIGSAYYIIPPKGNINGKTPNIFWGIRQLQKQYGDIFGLYLGNVK